MMQYINGFACTCDEANQLFVIKLIQTEPSFTDDEGNDDEANSEVNNDVVSIVANRSTIENLTQILQDMLYQE